MLRSRRLELDQPLVQYLLTGVAEAVHQQQVCLVGHEGSGRDSHGSHGVCLSVAVPAFKTRVFPPSTQQLLGSDVTSLTSVSACNGGIYNLEEYSRPKRHWSNSHLLSPRSYYG